LFDKEAFEAYVKAAGRESNFNTMLQYWKDMKQQTARSGRGRQSQHDDCRHRETIAMVDSLQASEKCLKAIWDHVTNVSSTTVNSYDAGHSSDLTCTKTRYEYKADRRGRAYAATPSYQSMSRSLRYAVAPGIIEDWDMEAAQWTLLSHLIRALDVEIAPESMQFKIIHEYAAGPAAMLERFTQSIGVDAKQTLLAILNGGTIPDAFQQVDGLLKLQEESRMLRWLACSCMPAAVQ